MDKVLVCLALACLIAYLIILNIDISRNIKDMRKLREKYKKLNNLFDELAKKQNTLTKG
jgi:hypothetical protein